MVRTAEVNERYFGHYVFGDAPDEQIEWYSDGTAASRYSIHQDERGSAIALSGSAGTAALKNRYDEYGVPQSGNAGRFQYTGQMWLPEIGLYYYKNRMYSPTLGRFLQTDPTGTNGGINLYAYVGNDPINAADPMGTDGTELSGREPDDLSRTIDFTPQGVGWGRHSYDWGTGIAYNIQDQMEDQARERAAWNAAFQAFFGCSSAICLVSGGSTASASISLAAAGAFVLGNDPQFGSYFGTEPRPCGRQLCTTGSGGESGALQDYAAIARNLGVSPGLPETRSARVQGIIFSWTFTQTPISAGVLGLRIYPNVYSRSGASLLPQRSVIDIPPGAFPGQILRVRVHYYGPGPAPF